MARVTESAEIRKALILSIGADVFVLSDISEVMMQGSHDIREGRKEFNSMLREGLVEFGENENIALTNLGVNLYEYYGLIIKKPEVAVEVKSEITVTELTFAQEDEIVVDLKSAIEEIEDEFGQGSLDKAVEKINKVLAIFEI